MAFKNEDPSSYAKAGMQWLYDLNLVKSPAVMSNLLGNILAYDKGILNAEVLTDRFDKKMLVYIELTRWARWFRQKSIERGLIEALQEILPEWSFRIIFDKKIFEIGLERSQKYAIGALHAKNNNSNHINT